MRERSEIAARADRAFFGNDRNDVAVEHFDEELDDLETNAAAAERENIGAEQHHGADLRLGKWSADAAGMTAHEIDLELLQLVGGDVNVGKFPEAGADAVDDGFLPNDLLDNPPRGMDGSVKLRRNLDRLVFEGDAGNLQKRKRATCELQHAPRVRQISWPGNTEAKTEKARPNERPGPVKVVRWRTTAG